MIATLALIGALSGSPCDDFRSLPLPNVAVTAAESVKAAPAVPAHCRVSAVLTPVPESRIEVEIWLPLDGWNGKLEVVGNGGWAGVISTPAMAAALREGYATASTDTGHKGGSGAFAVRHDALVDFGYRSMHELTVAAKAMVTAFYQRPARLSYYNGCSTGGRQGMMEAQRYPDDFDAIVAGAPVYNQIHLNTSQVALQTQMLRDPALLVPPPKVALLANAVLNACDATDGVKDGIVSNPAKCAFDPAVLQCKNGDGADCLTAKQVESVKRAYAPVKTTSGQAVYPGHAYGFENGWRIPDPAAPINPLFADMPRFVAHQDAKWDVMTFDLDADLAAAMKNGGYIEASDPNLSRFKARGGKLLLYHGWADPGPAPANTIQYYESVVKTLGGSKQDDWMRLFLLPGVGHCGGGVGPDQADYMAALERWRESNIAPDQIIAAKVSAGRVEITRPICAYPTVAAYKGSGSTNDAENFVCRLP
ncbi:MAG TPA: tannase/feruloyl esterase family alpha/beta hydrolase [Vicinamibacterales bacterium]|nr:tannase/feruloyl esterase family alpha/beta hydrolase [Vicinamibacterales bacterium]